MSYLATEAGDRLTTEAGAYLVLESFVVDVGPAVGPTHFASTSVRVGPDPAASTSEPA